MSHQIKQVMQDLAIYHDLITSLITLKVILEDIDKINIIIDLEINNKIKQLELLELRIMTLKNRFLGRPSNSIEEEIDNKEELKEEDKEWEFKSVRILPDLSYEKNDEIVEITRKELKLKRLRVSQKSIVFFKKINFFKGAFISCSKSNKIKVFNC